VFVEFVLIGPCLLLRLRRWIQLLDKNLGLGELLLLLVLQPHADSEVVLMDAQLLPVFQELLDLLLLLADLHLFLYFFWRFLNFNNFLLPASPFIFQALLLDKVGHDLKLAVGTLLEHKDLALVLLRCLLGRAHLRQDLGDAMLVLFNGPLLLQSWSIHSCSS